VSGDAQFSHPVRVPDGFPGNTLTIPHPTDGQLYVKLRDDPSVVHRATLAVQELPPNADEAARAAARQAVVRSESDGGANANGRQLAESSTPPATAIPHSQVPAAEPPQPQRTEPKPNP
jgi:hypothetical protein